MIAGERFSDHPETVCPMLAALLRAYNDSLDDQDPQDLYRLAAQVVGTRATPEIERQRIERCVAWTRERNDSRNPLTRTFRRPRRTARRQLRLADATARRAVKAIRPQTPAAHATVTALVDELCAIGPRADTTDNIVSLSPAHRVPVRPTMPHEPARSAGCARGAPRRRHPDTAQRVWRSHGPKGQ